MKRMWILRVLCPAVAALVVAAGVSVTLALSHRPTTVEAADVDSGVELPTTLPTTSSPTLRRGDRAPEVRDLQRRLGGPGYWRGGALSLRSGGPA